MEMEIGNCKQVWQTVNSPKCKRLHGADDETTSTTSTEDLLKISTALDNMIEQNAKFFANLEKTMRAGFNKLATLIQQIGNDPRQTEKSPNFSQNLANPTKPILNSEQQTKSDYLRKEAPATLQISSDCYFCQKNLPLISHKLFLCIYFSTGIFQGPSSLWMFYRIVSESVRKKKTHNKFLIDC
jgi:hypothetical protein